MTGYPPYEFLKKQVRTEIKIQTPFATQWVQEDISKDGFPAKGTTGRSHVYDKIQRNREETYTQKYTQKTIHKSGQNPKMCLGNPQGRWKKRNGGNKQKTNDEPMDVKS